MLSISQKLKAAVKLSDLPAYKIAQQANLDPSTLSKLICGIAKIRGFEKSCNQPRNLHISPEKGVFV